MTAKEELYVCEIEREKERNKKVSLRSTGAWWRCYVENRSTDGREREREREIEREPRTVLQYMSLS